MTDYTLIGEKFGEAIKYLLPLVIGIIVGIKIYDKKKKNGKERTKNK